MYRTSPTPSSSVDRVFSSSHLRRFGPIAALAILTFAIWCAATGRWSVEAWATPLQLHGDPMEIYARVRAAAEDLTAPLSGYSHLPRLGAPFGADWTRYPVSDRVVFTLLGLVARATGVFAAVNLAMVVVHFLDALAFYLCARFLRWRWEWALATALLFTFCSYNFRWSVTVSFSLSFVVPPLLLLCGWIARPAPAVAVRGWTWLALVIGVWLGGANPYLGFFGVQLAVGAAILQLARRREFARWRAGVTVAVAAAVSFLLHNGAYFLGDGGVSRLALSRNYAGSEIYALKLADLVVPPEQHPLAALDAIGRAYQAQSALRTEFFVNYLGVFGMLGLAILLVRAARGLIRRHGRPVPDAFLGVMWTALFSAVGGVNSLLALAGLDIFRASNRNSIFILVWALFALGSWCQRRWRAGPPVLRYGIPALVAAVGVLDSLPNLAARRMLEANAARVKDERTFVASLEERLGPDAEVFQIPSTVFPEAGVVASMSDYEHFMPYLFSKTLRFSYGALRGTPESRCLRALGRLPAPMLKEQLELAGFHAIWINRRGLPEHGNGLVKELRALGLEQDPQILLPEIEVFLLKPAARPKPLELTDTNLYEPWDIIGKLTQPRLVVFDGWYDLERDGGRTWRWARDVGTGGIRMPRSAIVELSFWAYSLSPGQIVVTSDGREVYRRPISPTTRDERTIRLVLGQGRHTVEWRFTGRVTHPPTSDDRQLGFAIENLRLTELECLPPASPGNPSPAATSQNEKPARPAE